ncbi:MAG: type II toxin-antitoxin system death-on-curing family toxin [Rhodospirillales bacterium]|jgi:death on curing protein|nr:type II toxin-antitoxin system death-on-curing family toxin [Rhodospirillales bacterium]MBT4041455.1 type II toxin-antitoxin system death-on-curing family toxin [Rhodospirillales bacterium]MBT4625138.1 type II toxin-antitoxin system death-on-curing family toxin [Rhodospirillales bacterium]MBT5353296.1 type II toxin-antitoxin system death-on-curing family toxin [Rhodospirillales bacterium]MBT5519693.1 type II toxin-antitoxin system death-on-curing family toxin [Rhodospirillales bacterium]
MPTTSEPAWPEPVWIDEEEAIAINAVAVARFGGLSGDVRDETILKAALGRPLNKWHYDEPKPDIYTLAAAYCFALVKGHAFHDGNKRTAYIVAIVFLDLNGINCAPEQADIVTTMLGAADGSVTEEELAEWFKRNCPEKERQANV